MRLYILLFIPLILLSCTVQLEDNPNTVPVVQDEDNYRPYIPRTYPDENPESQYNPDEEQYKPGDVFINTTAEVPHINLDIPLGDMLYEHHPLLTVHEFPLLKHPIIWLDNQNTVGYDEEILFDFGENSTGEIVFRKSGDTEEIGTFLFFEEDKPIFEYGVFLRKGYTWYDITGRDIQILGHTYVVSETTNDTVVLYGRDVPNNLLFEDGKRLKANSTTWPNTKTFVGSNYAKVRLYADDPDTDGILLSPGESLVDNIGQERLVSQLLDISYVGSPMQKATIVSFDRSKYGFDLEYITIDNREMKISLVEDDAGEIFLGELDHPLRIHRCPKEQPYCIEEEDLVLLTARDGRNYLMRYSGVSNSSRMLNMRTIEGDRYLYEFIGDPTTNARTEILFEGEKWAVKIGAYDNETDKYNISIEQGFVRDTAEFVTKGGFVIRAGEPNATYLPVEIIIPRERSRNGKEEKTGINLTYFRGPDEWRIDITSNITFVEDPTTKDLFGVSEYGMAIWLDRDRDELPPKQGYEADLLLPESDMYGTIAVEG